MSWIDLSSRAKFALSGPDRVRYLNGQVTNNVARLKEGDVCPALVCTHKGKIEAEVFVTHRGEFLLIDGPSELREPLFARLAKYIIADDCELEDVTEAWALFHHLPEDPSPEAPSVNRFGRLGNDVWAAAGAEVPGPVVAAQETERIRLCAGRAGWPSELSLDVFPQEVGLEDSHVDFHKGCYLGQEVISRLRSVGQVNRHLRAFTVSAGVVTAGQKLWWEKEGKWAEGGVLTSVFESLALALVKRAADGADTFRVGEDENSLCGTVKCRETTH